MALWTKKRSENTVVDVDDFLPRKYMQRNEQLVFLLLMKRQKTWFKLAISIAGFLICDAAHLKKKKKS